MARPLTPPPGTGRRARVERRDSSFMQSAARFLRLISLILFSLALTGSVGYCGWSLHHFIYASGYFRIREFKITGASEELKQEAHEWLGRNVAQLRNNLCLQHREFLESQLSRLPRARKVTVSKVYPGTLMIDFVERRPLVIAQIEDYFLMDEEGVLLARISPEKMHKLRLPLLTGLKADVPRPGEKVKHERLGDILKAARHIRDDREQFLQDMIVEWNVNGRSEVTAILNTRLEVSFGEKPPIEELDRLVTALTMEKDLEHAKTIDLSWGQDVVCRY